MHNKVVRFLPSLSIFVLIITLSATNVFSQAPQTAGTDTGVKEVVKDTSPVTSADDMPGSVYVKKCSGEHSPYGDTAGDRRCAQ